jgi:hypothetical protein
MSHLILQRAQTRRERLLIWAAEQLERTILASIPKGQFRRRLLARTDRALLHYHAKLNIKA